MYPSKEVKASKVLAKVSYVFLIAVLSDLALFF